MPYDATGSVEQLLQFMETIFDGLIRVYGDSNDQQEIKVCQYYKLGLHSAITGLPLINTPGRKAWLFFINNLLFTFETLHKLRNPTHLRSRLVAGTPTNMKAFHQEET